jgi:hypothetical protein
MTGIESAEFRRLGAKAGVVGAVLTLVAGAIHPKGSSDVGTVSEWMTRAGNSEVWIADHLALLVAAVLLLPASVAIAHSFPEGASRSWAHAAWITNVIATAVAVVTFLFDGAVVKNVAELWQQRPDDVATQGAAILATKTGFILVAGLQLTVGMAVLLFAVAGLRTQTHPRWLGALALLGAITSLVPGAVHYLVGSSTWTANLVYVSSAAVAIWFLLMSLRLWRAT